MKRLLCLLLLFACGLTQLYAQAPGLIKFQAVAREAGGEPITQPVDVRLTVLRGSADGSPVYADEQTATPNNRGLFTVNLGAGPVSGDFNTIDWAGEEFFLRAEIRQAIGDPFLLLGPPQPILSVPYALYGEDEDADPANELQRLTLSGGTLTLNRGGGSVELFPATRTLNFPAATLDFNSESEIITNAGVGLVWANNFATSASIVTRKPADYAGGDVTLTLLFLVSTQNSRRVEFFARPRSYSDRAQFGDAASVPVGGVNVTRTNGFGRLYEVEMTLPGERLSEDWWYISIQRNSGFSNALTSDVNVLGTTLEYRAR